MFKFYKMVRAMVSPCTLGGGGGGTTAATIRCDLGASRRDATGLARSSLACRTVRFDSVPTVCQGMTVAPINGTQLQGMDFLEDNALNGSPDPNAARGAMTNISNGAYMNNDPWLSNGATQAVINSNAQAMGNAAAIGQNAQTDAQFAQGGAYGGCSLPTGPSTGTRSP